MVLATEEFCFSYVVQDDVVFGSLTVKENITFAANLRLKSSTTKQKEEIVRDLLSELNLDKCADTRVGTELIKGVSGGERKRCHLATEMITQTHILFLGKHWVIHVPHWVMIR